MCSDDGKQLDVELVQQKKEDNTKKVDAPASSKRETVLVGARREEGWTHEALNDPKEGKQGTTRGNRVRSRSLEFTLLVAEFEQFQGRAKEDEGERKKWTEQSQTRSSRNQGRGIVIHDDGKGKKTMIRNILQVRGKQQCRLDDSRIEDQEEMVEEPPNNEEEVSQEEAERQGCEECCKRQDVHI